MSNNNNLWVNSNRNYWMDRMMTTMFSGEKKVKDYEKTLKQAYEETKRAISKEVASFYQDYAEEEGISLQAAHKRLKVDELINFNQRSKDYLQEVKAIESRPEPLQAYETKLKKLSGRAYMTRLDALKSNIESELTLLAAKQDIGMGQTLDSVHDDSYYRTIYDLHKFTKTGVDFAQPGQSQLKAASRYQWNGDNYSSRIWKNKDKLLGVMNQLIPQSFVRGFGSNQLAREMADKLEVSYSNAVRLARTEGRYVGNLGTASAYKESGVVTEFMFMATLDDKTSEICQEMDGKVMPLSDATPGIMMPPLHPYCRSTTVPYFPDDDLDALIDDRVSRNDKGKTYPIGKYQTYKEWAQAKTPASYVQTLLPEDAKIPAIGITGQPTSTLEDRVNQDMDFEEYYNAMPDDPQFEDLDPYMSKQDITNIETLVKSGKAIPGNPNEDRMAVQSLERLRSRLRKFNAPVMVTRGQDVFATHPALETPEGVIQEAKRVMVRQIRAAYNANHFMEDKTSYEPTAVKKEKDIQKDWMAKQGTKLISMAKKISSRYPNASKFQEVIRKSEGDSGGNCGEDEIMRTMMEGTERADPPQKVSRTLFNKMKQKGYTELYRGVGGAEFKKQFKHGELYYGKGIYGNGTYTAVDYATAYDYAGYERDHITSMILHPDARLIDRRTLGSGLAIGDDLMGAIEYDVTHDELESLQDMGRQALALGYDGILIRDSGYVVVLNRSMLIIPDDE